MLNFLVPQVRECIVQSCQTFDNILTMRPLLSLLTFAAMLQQPNKDGLSRGHIVIMAICTGLIVANIYYCQPLLVLISKSFAIPASKAGRIAFLTQLGYALGLL